MDLFECDAVVIGAGAIGLAIARQLAIAKLETFILEKNFDIGMETSARNSEIIHAGIYYPQGSLKANLCVQGRRLLYTFCERHGVGHKQLGKLIVATRVDQETQLAAIVNAASNNGVHDLRWLSKTEIASFEPDLFAMEGLHSPSTGIIDSHQYMLALLGDAESAGASLVRRAEVIAIARKNHGYTVTIKNAGDIITLNARILINSAGLWAQKIAGMIDGLDRRFVPPMFLAKGSYATLLVKSPFRRLVYPVPETGGLGVHLTLDLGGRARFGPDVQWLETNDPAAIDYTVSPSLPREFVPRISDYWPAVTETMLAPGYSGVRPKTGGAKDPCQDFLIQGPQAHGLSGLVNLFAMESPGLTSSLAVAQHVEMLLQ